MSAKLTPISAGVVHSTARRTRIRLPRRFRTAEHMQRDKHALQKVSGVHQVETTTSTGSILIEHEPHEAIVENIGEALGEAAPELLKVLLGETGGVVAGALIRGALVTKFFR